MCFAPQQRALFQHLNFQKCSETLGHLTSKRASRHKMACTFSTSQLPKVLRNRFEMCFTPHNSVHFFDIAASKSAPKPSHIWLRNVLHATQRRALFRHLNFQKWSDVGVLCAFRLGNVLRATTACNFSSLIWPAGSAPAALASLLFDPPEPQIIGKTQCFATSLPFSASASSFFLLFLFYSSFF